MTHANFVSTEWLDAHLGDPELRVIDASWHMPTSPRKGDAEFREGHIPGAVFFNIDEIADTSSGLPHMLPTPAAFARAMGELGLGDGMRFVIYDSLGLFAAARVWWTLRAFGVRDVFILEGGLPKWTHEGRTIEGGEANPKPAVFTPRLDANRVADVAKVKATLASGAAQVLDARPADRFEGRAPEPYAGRAQHALRRGAGAWVAEAEGGAGRDAEGAWRRSRQAGADDLRLRRQRRDPGAGGRGGRRRGRRPL
jgi:thiosulfate/3-mercaptopyruvate sulfurtransferase